MAPAKRFAVVAGAMLAIVGCGRVPGLGIRAKDAGAFPDRVTERDLFAEIVYHPEAAAEGSADAGEAGPEIPLPGPDGAATDITSPTGRDARDGGQDADGIPPKDVAADVGTDAADARLDTVLLGRDAAGPEPKANEAGPDARDLGLDARDVGPDARDASGDSDTIQREIGADRRGRDRASDGGDPLRCTGTLVLGSLPLAATGTNPAAVASGDLDGDGNPDVVTTNSGSDTVSVLLGKGDGNFATKVDYPTGLGPASIVLGDFNRDGRLDIVAANAGWHTVSVLLGTGHGSFAVGVEYDTGIFPSWLGSSDLDGDGKVDLIVASAFDSKVSVLLGKGDGTFAAKVDYDSDVPPSAVAMGDVNGDGTLDLVAADWPSEHQNLDVLLGGGDGTFSQKLSIPSAGTGLYSLALSDLNGDGRLDLVAAVMDSDKVGVLLGTSGGFAARVDYPTGDHLSTTNVWSTCNPTWSPCYPKSVTLGDLNRDGKTDLVVANESSGSLSILLGAGDGTFAAKVDYPAASIPISVTLADLDWDGSLDVVVANHNADGVGVMLGRGDGTFVAGTIYAAEELPASPIYGDLNGDGKTDMVEMGADRVRAWLATTGGTFTAPVETAGQPLTPPAGLPGKISYYSVALALGDLDGDGKPDLVAARYLSSDMAPGPLSPRTSVFLGTGDGRFAKELSIAFDGFLAASVALVDLNQDGKLDMVARADSSNLISVLLGKGDGTFPSKVDYELDGNAGPFALGDLNADGKVDLVTSSSGAWSLAVWLGRGDGSFADKVGIEGPWAMTALTLVDVNRDGKLDLVASDFDSVNDTSWVDVLFGTGDGGFSAPVSSADVSGSFVGLGDLNGDGSVDQVMLNGNRGTVSVLLGAGDGTFSSGVDYAGAGSAALVDFDGDGRLDLLMANSAARVVTVLINSCQ
jgi:hypothetical protein